MVIGSTASSTESLKSMNTFTKLLIGIIGLAHVGIFALETFFWAVPFVQDKFQNFTPEQLAAILAANQGVYNAFLAAGLVWGLLDKQNSLSILKFFLTCIAIAGVYGSLSLGRPTALLIQTAPAVIALLSLLVVNRRATKAVSS